MTVSQDLWCPMSSVSLRVRTPQNTIIFLNFQETLINTLLTHGQDEKNILIYQDVFSTFRSFKQIVLYIYYFIIQ